MRPLTIAALSAFLLLTTPVAGSARVAGSPESSWMIEGARVQDIVATGDLVIVGGEFSAAVTSSGEAAVDAENLIALDAVTGAPVWAQTVGSSSGMRSKVWDIDVSGSGRTLVVCGMFDLVGADARSNVAALDVTTGAVLPWAPSAPPCRSVDRSDDAVFAGGGRTVRALAADGSTTWVTETDGPVLALKATGTSVLAGGRFTSAGGASSSTVARLDRATGMADAGWALEPVPAATAGEGAFAIDLLVRGGDLFVGAGGADYVARFDLESGALAWWRDTSGSVQELELVEGMLAVGGHFQWVADADTSECGTNQEPVDGCASRMRLAAVDPRTGELLTWGPTVLGGYTGVWALEADELHGWLHVGGGFTSIAGVEQHDYARLPIG